MADNSERVIYWNTFFRLAWDEAKNVKDIKKGSPPKRRLFEPKGGTLPLLQYHSLAALSYMCLAIEARTKHLLDELYADRWKDPARRMSKRSRNKLAFESSDDLWVKLPILFGKGGYVDATTDPHDAIRAIWNVRNDVMHSNFGDLIKKLPELDVLILFPKFVRAMEDLNVQCGRHLTPDQDVLAIADLEVS